MTFWQAWPFSILVAGLAGVLLGIPVLRLRGDYLAIVTLGFGEIIRLIALSNEFKPLFGAAQGISNIPGPVIDLTAINASWHFELGNALNIYYVIFASVIVVAFIAIRLAGTRLGRAWRSMRADEDVAQAMGINLVRTKLLAFAIGAAFAGLGGAIFGSWLKGIFPNSFTLDVSINVLSLIIIGGLGSIPGVVLGALILIGLPEVLRELQDYRLLAFGILLVVTMVAKPEGLIPPPIRRLAEYAEDYRARKEA
jgi:branched-chain amino acid transport system permease protein